MYDELFYEALRIRRVEEKIVEKYPTDKIESPVHLSIGQEHHIVAYMKHLTAQDKVVTTYRSHAVYLAKGGDMKKMMAELYSRQTGVSKGKAGSMHLTYPEGGMIGSSAIVGAVFSHAIGLAYAEQFHGTNNFATCITGEGATEEGVFSECLNFSALRRLPVLFMVEDNGLAINIPKHIRQAYTLEKLADAYGIDYFYLDNGYDLLGCHREFGKIVNNMRENPRPIIVCVDTFRYVEHVGIRDEFNMDHRDPAAYEFWKARDPLFHDIDRIKEYDPKIANEVEEAVRFAEDSPYSDPSELLKDVY